MTDTKRLRELADMSNWYSDEKTELRSLILAACEELERLKKEHLALVESEYRSSNHSVAAARHCHELRKERDAWRDKFCEVRAEIAKAKDTWAVDFLQPILDRFPLPPIHTKDPDNG